MMFKRLWVYIREMFPLQVHLPFSLLLFLGIYSLMHNYLGESRIDWSFNLITGYVSLFSVSLAMRIADEFKDEETDRKLFPHRAYPRGAVHKRDLQLLLGTILLVILLINLWHFWLLLSIVIVIFYGFLTFKWFFVEERMRQSLILALLSHQPLAFLVNLYLILFSLIAIQPSAIQAQLPWADFILIALLFWMPVLAWETSRKIRARSQETEYVTYSTIFGAKKATLLPLSFLLIATGLSTYFHFELSFHWSHLLLLGLGIIMVLVNYLRFIFHPTAEHNLLKPTSEIFSTLLLFNLTVHSIIKIYHS